MTETSPQRPDRAVDRWADRLGLAGRPVGVALAATGLGLVLLGAGSFGLVHIVGGTWHANPRAAGFGVGLAALSFGLLTGWIWVLRRGSAR